MKAAASARCEPASFDEIRLGSNVSNPGRYRCYVVLAFGDEGALARLLDAGAAQQGEIRDVGGGRLIFTVADPDGNVFGLLQDPWITYAPLRERKRPMSVQDNIEVVRRLADRGEEGGGDHRLVLPDLFSALDLPPEL